MINSWVWGSYDGIHPGHTLFFREAILKVMILYGELDIKLNVAVVPDEVIKANKKRDPFFTHQERKRFIELLPYIDRVFIDSYESGLESLYIVRPQVICFGPDQKTRWDRLIEQKARDIGAMAIRIDYTTTASSSSIIKIHKKNRKELEDIVRKTIDYETANYMLFRQHISYVHQTLEYAREIDPQTATFLKSCSV
jgi:glycerol-3-phosphate cytidylyltransferase-like family protein